METAFIHIKMNITLLKPNLKNNEDVVYLGMKQNELLSFSGILHEVLGYFCE